MDLIQQASKGKVCMDNSKKWKKSTKTVYDQIMEVKRVKASVVFDSRYAIFPRNV